MIELRWVHRNMANDFYCGHFEDAGGYPRVLQYRQQIQSEPITKNGNLVGLKHIWSDWIDVPTVTEN